MSIKNFWGDRHSVFLLSFVVHVLIVCVTALSFPSFNQLKSDAVREISVDLVDISEIPVQKSAVRKSGSVAKKAAARQQITATSDVRPPRKIKEKRPVLSEMTVEKANVKASVPSPLLHMSGNVVKAPSDKKRNVDNLNVDKISALLDKTPFPFLRDVTAPSDKKRNVDNLDVDKISALLDKTPDRGTLLVRDTFDDDISDPAVQPDIRLDMPMTSDEIASLRSQIGRCWNPPIGLRGAADLSVRLRMQLNTDGYLSAPPQFMSGGDGAAFQAAIDSARRAVLRCQPYRLPPEKYVIWRDISVNFDPHLMLNE